jgi:two-component sensor histidine kinase
VADKACLTLWDDGKGLPEDRQAGTGMQLVAGFARQLHADVDWASQGGTRLSVTFPISAGQV